MSALLFLKLGLRRRYHVVHVHSLPDFEVFAAWTARLWGGKLLLDLHELFPEIFMARFRRGPKASLTSLVRFLEAASMSVADRVLTVNDRTRAILVARGCPTDKLDVVMNSPDETVYRPGVVMEEAHEGLRLVYVGGINPERDLGILVRATAAVAASESVELHIVGYGARENVEVLRRLAADLGLGEKIHFGDSVPQEEVLRFLRASDVGVVTYERNPLTEVAVPNKVFEYIQAGKPLVLPDLPTLRELFEGGALFYAPGDARDLGAQILSIWKQTVDVGALQRRARKVYEASRWQVMGSRLEGAYRALLGLPRRAESREPPEA